LQVFSWKPPVLKVFGRLTGIGSSFLINSNNYTQHCLCPQWCMLCMWVLLPTSWVSLLGLSIWHSYLFLVHHTRNRNDTKCLVKSPLPFFCCSETNTHTHTSVTVKLGQQAQKLISSLHGLIDICPCFSWWVLMIGKLGCNMWHYQ
jgi:hypothetical protein